MSSPSVATLAWKPGRVGVDDVVGAEGRHDATRPTGLAEPRVRLEGVEGTVGRGEELDAEPLEERTRPEVLLRQARRDLVVHGVGVLVALSGSVTPKTSWSVWSSQSFDGVPRKRV